MRRLLLATLTALLALGLVAGAADAQTQTDPASTYQTLTEDLNRGDIPAALSLFTDDVVRKGGQLCGKLPNGCMGKDALRKEYETQQANHTQVTVVPGSVQVSGNRLTAREEVRADSFRAVGAERLIVLKTIELRGDKIAYIESKQDLSDPQTAAYAKAQAAAAAPASMPGTGGGGAATWRGLTLLGLLLLGSGVVRLAARRRN